MENVLWENWSNWKFETADGRMQTGLYRLRSESKLLITKTSWLSFASVLYKSTMTQTNPLAGRSVSVWACEDQFILRDSFSISFPTFHEPLVTNEPVCKFAIFGNNLSIDSAGSLGTHASDAVDLNWFVNAADQGNEVDQGSRVDQSSELENWPIRWWRSKNSIQNDALSLNFCEPRCLLRWTKVHIVITLLGSRAVGDHRVN